MTELRHDGEAAAAADKRMGRLGYLLLGPESSGTKLTGALLRAAGCRSVAVAGNDDGPELPLDGHPPLLRRSMPHDRCWFAVAELLGELEVDQVQAIVTGRDWFAMAESQVARGLTPDRETAFANIRRAYREIWPALTEAGVPFVLSSYEALVSRPDYAHRLLEFLGLPRASLETYDGNEKWYAERPKGWCYAADWHPGRS